MAVPSNDELPTSAPNPATSARHPEGIPGDSTTSAPHPEPIPHDLPAFLRFAPVPVKARRDGWGAGVQLRFIVHLARGASAGEAARAVGRSRQSAYALLRRAGAEGFAAAWDAAVAFAGEARGAARLPGSAGPETLLVPRYYRGRLIGFVQREDVSGLMARVGRLDRFADRLADRLAGAAR